MEDSIEILQTILINWLIKLSINQKHTWRNRYCQLNRISRGNIMSSANDCHVLIIVVDEVLNFQFLQDKIQNTVCKTNSNPDTPVSTLVPEQFVSFYDRIKKCTSFHCYHSIAGVWLKQALNWEKSNKNNWWHTETADTKALKRFVDTGTFKVILGWQFDSITSAGHTVSRGEFYSDQMFKVTVI